MFFLDGVTRPAHDVFLKGTLVLDGDNLLSKDVEVNFSSRQFLSVYCSSNIFHCSVKSFSSMETAQP